MYRKLFRFSKQNVEWLSHHFLPESLKARGGALSLLQCSKVTLRYLSDPGFQNLVAQVMGVSQSTVSNVLSRSFPSIASKSSEWIKLPTTEEEVRAAKEKSFRKLGFPCTIGAIDCTHVKIEKPNGVFGNEFINRKSVATFNIQATCNESYVFTSCHIGWPGSFQTQELK